MCSKKRKEVDLECGKRLKAVLANYGMQQNELAGKIGCTEQHISSIISGRRRLTEGIAKKLIEIFPDISYDWLMNSDDYKFSVFQKKNDEYNALIEIISCYHKYKFDSEGYSGTKEYTIVSPKGSKRDLSQWELDRLINQISEFIEYKCAFIFRKDIDCVKNIYELE